MPGEWRLRETPYTVTTTRGRERGEVRLKVTLYCSNSYNLEETESPSFEKQRLTSSTVRLNVGGKVFHASWQLLLQVSESRLGQSGVSFLIQNISLSFIHNLKNIQTKSNLFMFNFRKNRSMQN